MSQFKSQISFAAILLASLSALGFAPTVRAQTVTVDSEGATSQGLNDSSNTAQALSALDATAFGYIDSSSAGDVDVYSFDVGGNTPQLVYFDVDYSNDVNTPETDDDDGMDSILSVFNAQGRLIEEADDIGFPPDPGSAPNGDYDPFLALELSPGRYFVSVSAWANYSNGSINSFDGISGSSSGQYCLQVRTSAGQNAPANDCSSVAPQPVQSLGGKNP